jgi:Ca2+-transporting ATPase
LLIATGLVYLVLGSIEEAIALGVSIFVVIGITLYQEAKTERTLQALRDLSSPRAHVIRNGQKITSPPAGMFVRGDILVLSEGDRVPPTRLSYPKVNLAAEESLLTGESAPFEKQPGMVPRRCLAGGDTLPAVFSGTLIVKGYGMP